MDWEAVGIILSLCGVLFNFIRFGKWQGIIETKVTVLERDSSITLTKFDVLNKALRENNEILTELKVKIELMLEKKGR